MVHYNLKLEDAQTMANELDDLSACVQVSNAIMSDISNQGNHILVEVMALDFNTQTKEYERNIGNTYDVINCALQYGMEPVGVTQDVLDYLVAKIPRIKKEIAMLDDACLNAVDPDDMDELNVKYVAKTKLLNLVYRLSSANLYVYPDMEVA